MFKIKYTVNIAIDVIKKSRVCISEEVPESEWGRLMIVIWTQVWWGQVHLCIRHILIHACLPKNSTRLPASFLPLLLSGSQLPTPPSCLPSFTASSQLPLCLPHTPFIQGCVWGASGIKHSLSHIIVYSRTRLGLQ